MPTQANNNSATAAHQGKSTDSKNERQFVFTRLVYIFQIISYAYENYREVVRLAGVNRDFREAVSKYGDQVLTGIIRADSLLSCPRASVMERNLIFLKDPFARDKALLLTSGELPDLLSFRPGSHVTVPESAEEARNWIHSISSTPSSDGQPAEAARSSQNDFLSFLLNNNHGQAAFAAAAWASGIPPYTESNGVVQEITYFNDHFPLKDLTKLGLDVLERLNEDNPHFDIGYITLLRKQIRFYLEKLRSVQFANSNIMGLVNEIYQAIPIDGEPTISQERYQEILNRIRDIEEHDIGGDEYGKPACLNIMSVLSVSSVLLSILAIVGNLQKEATDRDLADYQKQIDLLCSGELDDLIAQRAIAAYRRIAATRCGFVPDRFYPRKEDHSAYYDKKLIAGPLNPEVWGLGFKVHTYGWSRCLNADIFSGRIRATRDANDYHTVYTFPTIRSGLCLPPENQDNTGTTANVSTNTTAINTTTPNITEINSTDQNTTESNQTHTEAHALDCALNHSEVNTEVAKLTGNACERIRAGDSGANVLGWKQLNNDVRTNFFIFNVAMISSGTLVACTAVCAFVIYCLRKRKYQQESTQQIRQDHPVLQAAAEKAGYVEPPSSVNTPVLMSIETTHLTKSEGAIAIPMPVDRPDGPMMTETLRNLPPPSAAADNGEIEMEELSTGIPARAACTHSM